MNWYPYVGYSIMWIAFIAAIILYAMKRKWYPIMYLISISIYIFTIAFVIDVFDISKNGILGLLALSTILMIGMGFYLSNRFKK